MPIDDLACGSEPCFCKTNRQYRKGENESFLFDFESIGKGPAHLFRYAYKSRCFSGGLGCQSDENALFQLSARNA